MDTNIFVSALFFGGLPRVVYDLIDSRAIVPCFTSDTLAELVAVLNSLKFERERSRLSFSIADFTKALLSRAVLVDAKIPIITLSVDPSDDKFLACAIVSKAQYIVSGDEHLLSLKNIAGIPILTPRRFLNSFTKHA